MVDIEKEQEIWKSYPDYPFIEANQFGKIRTKDHWVTDKNGRRRLIKGHVLKQQLKRNGYLYVAFGTNGKQVDLYVHRVVATSHLPNPNNYPEVNHKDNNPKNNATSNLEWCTHEQNVAYKEKCGVPAKEATKVLRKPVFAVNLETFKVLKFESQHEAACQLDIAVEHINGVINGREKTASGYLFAENESEITEEKIQKIRDSMKSYPIIAVHSKNLKIILFKSQAEAAIKLGINSSSINNTLKGRRNTAGGYCFYSADLDAVEKIRVKFGNKVAIKAKELVDNELQSTHQTILQGD